MDPSQPSKECLPVLLVMLTGATYDDMLDLAMELQRREAELLVISESEQAFHLPEQLYQSVQVYLSGLPLSSPSFRDNFLP